MNAVPPQEPLALSAGALVDALSLRLVHEPVPGAQVVAGAPTTGWIDLDGGWGVWEMTPGSMRDVEVDEVFIVLSGRAAVAFDHPGLPPIELRPGSVVRLVDGMRTVWTVHETLRKAYRV